MAILRGSPGRSPQQRRRRRRWIPRIPEWLKLGALACVAILLFGVGALIVWASVVPIPSISDFQNREVAQSTQIYDRTGNVLLYDVHGTQQRISVPLDQISPYIQEGAISIEDETFYQNAGFRPLSFLRAAIVDLFTGSYAEGGSTITQQVVKNALLTQDKTVARKLEEIILALRLTRTYSKDQILDTYLNETPYGGTIYGVEEASQYFFGVDASNVDLAQAAYLAALPQAPTYYSPYGNNKADLDARKNEVLEKMKDDGYITEDQYTQAVAEQVQFKQEDTAGIKAPHFVFYILQELEQQYGVDEVENGGLRVITSLDYNLQQDMQGSIDKYSQQMQDEFNASNEGMVAVDPKTGQILAMVGSRDYFNDAIDGQVNVTLANRQPGSSFKPFVYATAFEEGYTPSTVVFDLPTQFSTACLPSQNTDDTPPCYSPVNYDGTFKGPMTLRDAIAQSENVPSIKVLYLAGIANSIKTAQDLGVTTLGNASQYGLTLVLGGGEVNLLQMTSAYGVFANDGVRNPPTGILQVTDSTGKVLESYQSDPSQVLDPQIARQINDVLSDDVARAPEFGTQGVLYFPGADVADKTGTTNDTRDAWVIGYTPSIAVGAWAGNNDNTPMVKKIAAFIVAPMWHDFMAQAIQAYPAPAFTPPAPDPDLSSLPPVLTGNWNTDPSQGIHDILYWVQKNSPRAGPPADPWADPQAAYWDYPVQIWAAQNGYSTSSVPDATSSSTPDLVPETGAFAITSPAAGTSLSSANALTITSGDTANDIASVTYYINGAEIGTATTAPYSISLLPTSKGPTTLRAVATMQDGTIQEQTISFTVQ